MIRVAYQALNVRVFCVKLVDNLVWVDAFYNYIFNYW